MRSILSIVLLFFLLFNIQAQTPVRYVYTQGLSEYIPTTSGRFGSALYSNDEWLISARRIFKGNNQKLVLFKYDKFTDSWKEHQTLVPFQDSLYLETAYGVNFQIHGNYLAVAAEGPYTKIDKDVYTGRVYIYRLQNDQWKLNQILPYPGREKSKGFSRQLVLGDSSLFVGCPDLAYVPGSEDSLQNAGGVAEYHLRSDGLWKFEQFIVAPFPRSLDNFGASLGLYDDHLAIGAPFHDYDEDDDNFVPQAGAIFLYKKVSNGQWQLQEKIVHTARESSQFIGLDLSMDSIGLVYQTRGFLSTWSTFFLPFENTEIRKEIPAPPVDVDTWDNSSVYQKGAYILIGSQPTSSDLPNGSDEEKLIGAIAIYKWNGNKLSFVGIIRPPDYAINTSGFGLVMCMSRNRVYAGHMRSPSDGFIVKTEMGAVFEYVPELCNFSHQQVDITACDQFISPSTSKTWNSSGTYYDTSYSFSKCAEVVQIHLTIKNSSYAYVDTVLCGVYITHNGRILQSSGTFFDTIPNSQGCDSIIRIGIISVNPDASIVFNNGYLSALNKNYPEYKWFDCISGDTLQSGTSSNYRPVKPGLYSLYVSNGTCSNTSACYQIHEDDILDFRPWDNEFNVYPNPTSELINIHFREIKKDAEVMIYDLEGKMVQHHSFLLLKKTEIILPHRSGIYSVLIRIPGEEDRIIRILVL